MDCFLYSIFYKTKSPNLNKMKTLNLVSLRESFIKYEHRKYPEGQQDIIILDEWGTGFNYPIQILSRFNNWRDLELIVCTVAALRHLKVKEIHLYIPYILGARSDRQFQDGGTRYLKDAIASVINPLKLDSVTVLDPHSDVVENVIDNIVKIDNVSLVSSAITRIRQPYLFTDQFDKYVLVSPDAGAMKKIYNVAEKVEAKSIIIASKHREIATGKILSTEVHIADEDLEKDLIIIDDICDGGRTFIELAKALREQGATGRIYLVVTHGIFSAGFDELKKYFHNIFTTNSIKDIDDPFVIQTNIF